MITHTFYYSSLVQYFGAIRWCYIPAFPEIFVVILKQQIIDRALCITVMNSQKQISILSYSEVCYPAARISGAWCPWIRSEEQIRKWHIFLTGRNPGLKVNHNQNNPNKGKLTWATISTMWAVKLPLGHLQGSGEKGSEELLYTCIYLIMWRSLSNKLQDCRRALSQMTAKEKVLILTNR